MLHDAIMAELDSLGEDEIVMLKLTLPEKDNLYADCVAHSNVARVVALSGGYSREEANDRLSRQNGMVASFSYRILLRYDRKSRHRRIKKRRRYETLDDASIEQLQTVLPSNWRARNPIDLSGDATKKRYIDTINIPFSIAMTLINASNVPPTDTAMRTPAMVYLRRHLGFARTAQT